MTDKRVSELERRMAAMEVAMRRLESPPFLKDCRVDVYRTERVESVRLTHLPTGIAAEAPTKDEAIRDLAAALAK